MIFRKIQHFSCFRGSKSYEFKYYHCIFRRSPIVPRFHLHHILSLMCCCFILNKLSLEYGEVKSGNNRGTSKDARVLTFWSSPPNAKNVPISNLENTQNIIFFFKFINNQNLLFRSFREKFDH